MKNFFESKPGKEGKNKVEKYSCLLESGLSVHIEYKLFESQVESDPEEVVILLAGLQMRPDDDTLKNLSESYAECSGRDTYTLQSSLTSEAGVGLTEDTDLFYEEAKGIAEFIKDRKFKNVLIAGYSVGGMRGIDLAHYLREEFDTDIDGLILLSSPGMYQQEADTLKSNLLKDSLMTPGQVLQESGDYIKSFKRGVNGALSLLNALTKGSKVKREFGEMEKYNERVEDLDIPVIIINGSEDQVVESGKIIPEEVEPRDREEYLKNNIFKHSPYIKMVVADKFGKHGLPVFRAESVAAASIGLLDRFNRNATDS